MKRRMMLFSAMLVVVLLLFTACTAPQENTQSTEPDANVQSTSAQTEAAPVTEAAAQNRAYRAAYAAQLAELRAEFSETPQGDYEGQTGVLFADLMDLDTDGTPELAVLAHDSLNDQDMFRLDIYREENGKAVSLLREFVGSSYGFLDSALCFYIAKSDDGKLSVRVDDSHEYQDLKESYFTLSAGSVQPVVLSAQSSVGGWDEENPVDPDAYQIDGQQCSKADFESRRKALGGDSALSVYCQHIYDLQALDDFLNEKSDTYSGGALRQAYDMQDEQIQWVHDALFAVVG